MTLALVLACLGPALAWAQNPIVTENQLPGTNPTIWDVNGAGDASIQGFATDISVNKGQTVRFKIKTPAASYHIDIYRIGWYGGSGARLVGTGIITASLPQTQPNPLTNAPTGLVDCGNWNESAHWDVPASAVSGIYLARLVRNDTQGASHIAFVVRDDASHSDLMFQSSDATWQAYNGYGGNSLYVGTTSYPGGRAVKVSYNRPFSTRAGGGGSGQPGQDWLFNAEYPMVRWLEANGYDVTYTTDVDTDRRGNLITQHKAFLSVGHDEYWSAAARANVQAARDAGVNLAFFSGNEIYWKTRYEPSIDPSATAYRTLVCYKEGTLGENPCGTKCDPLANTWTGLWRDGCAYTPPADGCAPENALSGQISWDGTAGAIQVPDTYKTLRFWRNTSVASLGSGQTATLSANTLGHEWDWEQYPSTAPSGRIVMSSTPLNGKTHRLSLYRHSSGALVFGAGTVQWSWGLDGTHDRGGSTPSTPMRQATVNLLADMGVQPGTLQAGLVPATASTDHTDPVSVIANPGAGNQLPAGTAITISGTASDAGGGVVAGVEVSVDGGATWSLATGRESWTLAWTPVAAGTVTIKSRAFDDSGNLESAGEGANAVTVTVFPSCPCSIWSPSSAPTLAEDPEVAAVELGVKFQASIAGSITAIRFYKGAGNTGTHVGSLWSVGGALLSRATFTGESTSGWQEVTLASPVAISPYTTYIASYHTNTGHYADDAHDFAVSVGGPPVRALADGEVGSNGVYTYSGAPAFPTSSWQASNYWVDVVFTTVTGPDTLPPTVTTRTPSAGSTGVPVGTSVAADFSEAMDPATIDGNTVQLRNGPTLIPAAVGYDAVGRTVTLTPAATLTYATTYTVTIQGGTPEPTVKDLAGNKLAADVTWTFTTANAPAIPPIEGPGGPILVISTAVNPFSRYYVEILRSEGLNAYKAMDITQVDATVLNGYDVVILGEMALSASQVSMLSTWANAGGTLIAMRPDGQLSGLLGLTPAAGTRSNAYLLVNTASGPGVGIVGQTIQYHGPADLYTLSGATSVATLYQDPVTATSNPAVTTRAVGANGGSVVAFTYDLARSVVYTRQGNPAWAGQKRDGQSEPIRSDDLYFGNAPGDPQPDWVDLNKVAIPQADEQQRLLANVILKGNLHRMPLPRFWYLPKGLKAAVVMTGDNHGDTGMQPRFDIYRTQSPPGCSVDDWECVRATGYEYVGTAFTDAQAQFYNGLGFEVALHVNTGCVRTSASEYDEFVTTQLGEFTAALPSVPAPSTNRNHCIAWSDWSSVPEVEAAHGIRLDTNYYYWPAAWIQDRPGLFTGSGFPMRFAKSDGTIIDCYQAVTQMPDESGETFPQFCDALLDKALGAEGYYGVFTTNMHFDSSPEAQSDAIVQSAQAHGIPVVSAKQMLTWLDGRNGSSFGSLSWSANALHFTVALAPGSRNLKGMVPLQSVVGPLATLTRGGSPVAYTLQTIKGIDYTFFTADTGAYVASYSSDTTPPSISNVVHAPHADGTATITWTTDELSTSRVDYGTSAGSLTSNQSDPTFVTGHSVTLTGLQPGALYYYRVTSTDAAANPATFPAPPAAPLSFSEPAPPCFVDQTSADFALGTATNVYVARSTDGEVILAPTFASEFEGGALPGDWTSVLWSNGATGGATVAGGAVSEDGARLSPLSTTGFAVGRSVEFVATFTATAFQHAGLGGGDNSNTADGLFGDVGQPWVMFSTNVTPGPNLYARVNPGSDVSLGTGFLGAPHRYRIDWRADSVVFSIDGASVNRRAAVLAAPMRPGASDFTAGGASLAIAWMRLTPYAASGTFESRVYDAGSPTPWGALSWTAQTPAGTSVAMAFRTGSTPTPDGTWSAYTPVAASGGAIGVTSRYLQYRAQLATSDPGATPVLESVSVTCCGDVTPPSAIGNLAALRLPTDSNGDGTRQIRLTFTKPADAATVEVYRAKFGNYPVYDDPPNAGSVPPVPAYPPSPSRWTLTAVTATNQTDEVAQRDEYYYVVFSRDACGNVSPVSNRAGGTLNYVLGDVHDGQAGHTCVGNNVVTIEDVSLLGAHYSEAVSGANAWACLDVGPTVTGATDARPLTDGALTFEDLMVFTLNYGATPAALAPPHATLLAQRTTTASEALAVEAPATVAAGEEFVARIRLQSAGVVHGVSVHLGWNAAVAEPIAFAAGDLMSDGQGIVLSPAAGTVDAARLGSAFSGAGTVAEVRFRALEAGSPDVGVASYLARDGANHPMTLGATLAAPAEAIPLHTRLGVVMPNPFRSRLDIQLSIAHRGEVRLQVFDLSGRVVRDLVRGEQPAGTRLVSWDGRDARGQRVAAGVYLVRLVAGQIRQTHRVQAIP